MRTITVTIVMMIVITSKRGEYENMVCILISSAILYSVYFFDKILDFYRYLVKVSFFVMGLFFFFTN